MTRGLLSDVHGVLYIHPRALEGSVAAVRRLRDAGYPHVFLTNSTQYAKASILATLHELGFEVPPERFMTAAEAAGDLLAEWGFARVGWLCVPELAEDIPGVEPIPPDASAPDRVDAVLVGDLGAGFTYEVLTQAFRWLHEGAPLVALARNRYYQGPDGRLVLDCGPFVRLLEEAGDTTALVAGKPSLEFFRAGLRRLGLAAADVAMVGDDLHGDLHPAMDLGMRALQVRTGKFREDRYARESRPADHLVRDLAEAVNLLLDEQGRKVPHKED
jgi:HAD superfamily hydrolase (TIGR01458 family)